MQTKEEREKRKEKMKTTYKLVVLFLVAALVSGAIGYTIAQSTSTFYITSGVFPGAPSFTIWKEGSTYYAKNQYGFPTYSSTNASYVLNSVSNDLVNGGTIYLTNGLYTLTTSILTYHDGTEFLGESVAGTDIRLMVASIDGFVLQHNYCSLKSLTISNGTIKTEGAGVLINGAKRYFIIENVRTICQYRAVECDGGSVEIFVKKCEFINCVYEAILLTGGGSEFNLESCHIPSEPTAQPTFGFHVRNWGGIYTNHADFIYCGTGLYINPNATETVTWGFFNELVIDYGDGDGAKLIGNNGNIRGITFVNSWFSSNNEIGFYVASGCDGVTLSTSKIFANGYHGVLIGQTGSNIKICDNDIAGNSQSVNATYHGVAVGANVSDFVIEGNRIGSFAGFSNTQGYNIIVLAGTSDYYIIFGNNLKGYVTGALSDGGSGGNKVVSDNIP